MTEEQAIKCLKFMEGCAESVKKEGEAARQICSMAIGAIKEVQQYRAIGTVEECRKAVGEQKPKKPKEVGHENSYVVCGNCGTEIYVNNEYDKTYSVFVNCETHRPHYCPNCGQAIRWEEIENA